MEASFLVVKLITYLMLAFVCWHWTRMFLKKKYTKQIHQLQEELNTANARIEHLESIAGNSDQQLLEKLRELVPNLFSNEAEVEQENHKPVKKSELKLPKPVKLNFFNFTRAGQKERLKRIVFTILLALAFSLSIYSPEANAALSGTMREAFQNEVSNFVTGIMNDGGNDVNSWARTLLLFFFIILVLNETMYYIFEGLDYQRILNASVFLFLTLIFFQFYDHGTQALWGIGDGIAGGLQTYLVGNTDNFFLTQWISKSTKAIVLKDLGFFDGLKATFILMQWSLVCLLLDLVSWLAALWADFGYALAKVVGICFIPFLMLQSTRNIFDAWFKFFVGFIILNVILRATLILAAITLKAVLSDVGVKFSGYSDPMNVVRFGIDQFYMLTDGIAMLFIAILFVFSSFSFAAAMAGGVGNLSGGLGQTSSMIARRLMTKFL